MRVATANQSGALSRNQANQLNQSGTIRHEHTETYPFLLSHDPGIHPTVLGSIPQSWDPSHSPGIHPTALGYSPPT